MSTALEDYRCKSPSEASDQHLQICVRGGCVRQRLWERFSGSYLVQPDGMIDDDLVVGMPFLFGPRFDLSPETSVVRLTFPGEDHKNSDD